MTVPATKETQEPRETTESTGGATPEPAQRLKDKLDVAQAGYKWMADAAKTQLSLLKEEIETDDTPFVAKLVVGAASGALSAATAGISEGLLSDFAAKSAAASKPVSDGGKEALKVLLENGLNAALGGLAGSVNATKDKGSLTAFLVAQMRAIEDQYQKAETLFIERTRHKLNLPEAEALAGTMVGVSKDLSARVYTHSVRDAWVSFIAQQAFGAVEDSRGNLTTDMSSDTDRARKAAREGTVPTGEPKVSRTFDGGEGVLCARVALPYIEGARMDGAPKVVFAMLTGVNDSVVSAYLNVPLSQINIPRKLETYYGGDEAFEVSVDETGSIGEFPSKEDMRWLVDRAIVSNPSRKDETNDYQLAYDGMHLLLQDVIIDRMGPK